eukprot:3702322-Rhodomonas_salina.1
MDRPCSTIVRAHRVHCPDDPCMRTNECSAPRRLHSSSKATSESSALCALAFEEECPQYQPVS